MDNSGDQTYKRGFVPYALAAFLIGIVGGFSTVLGPAFVQEIGIDYNNTTWTALAQAVSTAACAPVLGKLGDIIGRRKTLLLGIGIFTLGNIFSALAGSLLSMMAARFVVGLGTAAIAPVILSYIVTEFPSHAVAKGFSLYMLISSASVIFGPTLGGWMIAGYGWRVMLWLCAAISLTVLLLCTVLSVKDSAQYQPLTEFDVPGAILVIVFFSLALCVPSFGQNFGWTSAAFLTVAVAAVISLVALIRVEKRAKRPVLSGSFIRRRSFILSVLALFLTQGLMQANMTNSIIFVNMTRPNDTIISGYAISILYFGMSLGSVLLGPLADRIEPKTVLTGSLALTGLGCAVMLFLSTTPSVFSLALSLGILGFGLGGNGTIFMKVVLSGIPAQQAGTGTGIYGLFRDLAAPFGVVVLVPLFTNRMTVLVEHGVETAAAAVGAVKMLAIVEIFCVTAGIVVVRLLPRIHPHET
ncbi:MAG: MFS transporter [Oscillospiraceae bacterium]|nr:MFS transporter [Oscillospiraceae bacterium]